MTPVICDLLSLRNDKLDKNIPFDTFTEKFSGCILKEIYNTKEGMEIVKTMTGTNIKFEQKNNETETTEEELKSEMNSTVQDQRIKICIIREQKLGNIIWKLFSYIWGHFNGG